MTGDELGESKSDQITAIFSALPHINGEVNDAIKFETEVDLNQVKQHLLDIAPAWAETEKARSFLNQCRFGLASNYELKDRCIKIAAETRGGAEKQKVASFIHQLGNLCTQVDSILQNSPLPETQPGGAFGHKSLEPQQAF